MRFETQSLRLQRDRPAAGEGIVERRQPFGVEQLRSAGMVGVVLAGPSPTLPDLLPRHLQNRLVGRVLPLHQLPQDREQSVPFAVLPQLGREEVRPGRRIVHQLGEEHRPRRRQRPPRPPEMQCAGMPVPNGLLPRRRPVQVVERQRHLDQLPHRLHHLTAPCHVHRPTKPQRTIPAPGTSRPSLTPQLSTFDPSGSELAWGLPPLLATVALSGDVHGQPEGAPGLARVIPGAPFRRASAELTEDERPRDPEAPPAGSNELSAWVRSRFSLLCREPDQFGEPLGISFGRGQ